jgi:hypothetical protein
MMPILLILMATFMFGMVQAGLTLVRLLAPKVQLVLREPLDLQALALQLAVLLDSSLPRLMVLTTTQLGLLPHLQLAIRQLSSMR